MQKVTTLIFFPVFLFLIIGLSACAHKSQPPEGPGEKLIWASHPERPAWVFSTPKPTGGVLYFVGLSFESEASEQLSRNHAIDDALAKLVQYYGTMVKTKTESMMITHGLSSDIIDPTVASKSFQKLFSASVAKSLGQPEYYTEKWARAKGVGWKTFALCQVPKKTARESLTATIDSQIKETQKRASQADSDIAKQQAQNAIELWKQMKSEGLSEE